MSQRFLSRLLCLALLAFVLTPSAYAQRKDYRFQVEAQTIGNRLYFAAHNDGPATVTAEITVEADNMDSDIPFPSAVVVRPYSTQPLGSTYTRDRGKDASAQPQWSFMWGDMRAVHAADVRYRLPYENGSAYPISQAFGGPLTTHSDAATEHAVDFVLPEDTPIVAARDGRIVDMNLSYTRGGLDPTLKSKANFVRILHDDGTVATYAHLSRRQARVKPGDRVRAGTLIGYSGDTGYSSGPHLHFAVSRPQIGKDGRLRDVALPVMFYAGAPAVEFAPKRGLEVYAAYSDNSAVPVKASAQPAAVQPAEPAVSVASQAPVMQPIQTVAAEAPSMREVPFQVAMQALAAAESAPPQGATLPPSPPAPAPYSSIEADATPQFSPIIAGLAFFLTVIGVLCLLSQKSINRASRPE